MVGGWNREIAFFVPWLVSQIAALLFCSGVPRTLDRVEVVETGMLVLSVPDIIEDVELRLRAPIRGVGQSRALEVFLRFLCDIAGVPIVWSASDRIVDVAIEDQSLSIPEHVIDCGVRVRDQEHVRFLDLLETANRRTVEAEAVFEGVLGQLLDRNREVLNLAWQVTKSQIDEFVSLVGHEGQDISGRPCHNASLHTFV